MVARRPADRRLAARAAGRRGERGVALILAMLVLFVLAVVVVEIGYSAHVELDHAKAYVQSHAMRLLADAARQQAESALIMDAEQAQDTSGEGEGGDGLGSEGFLGGPGGPGGEQGGEESDEEASIADTTARTDSMLDEWNDALAMAPSFSGGDYDVYVEVEDEDGKVNLLGLWSPDKEQRDAQREIVRTVLDKAFEGTSKDISFPDATQILDKLDDWVRGNRGGFDSIPVPRLKTTVAEDEASDGDQLEADILDNDERQFPLTFGELALIDGLEPEHLTGFVEYNVWHPGLDHYLTIWSHLELKPPPPEDDPFGGSPFSNFTQGSLFDKSISDTSPQDGQTGDGTGEGEDEDELQPEPTNDGLVNVNTADKIVLRALAPPDVPTSFLDRVDEFRRNIETLKEEGALEETASLFGSEPGTGGEGDEEGGSSSSDDEEEDITHFVFETPDEVLSKVEKYFRITLGLDPGVQTEFVSRLGVTSHVFTIKVLVYALATDETSGRTDFTRRRSYRTVVWRMVTSSGVRTLTLLPLEPYRDPRRLEDFGDDLGEFGDEHQAYMQEQGISF